MYMVTSYISSAFPTFQMSISRGTDLFVDLFYCAFVNLIHPLLYDYISIFGLIIWPAKAFEVNVHDRWATLIKSIWKAVNVNNGRRLIPSHLPDYCPVSLLNLIWHRLLNIYWAYITPITETDIISNNNDVNDNLFLRLICILSNAHTGTCTNVVPCTQNEHSHSKIWNWIQLVRSWSSH